MQKPKVIWWEDSVTGEKLGLLAIYASEKQIDIHDFHTEYVITVLNHKTKIHYTFDSNSKGYCTFA